MINAALASCSDVTKGGGNVLRLVVRVCVCKKCKISTSDGSTSTPVGYRFLRSHRIAESSVWFLHYVSRRFQNFGEKKVKPWSLSVFVCYTSVSSWVKLHVQRRGLVLMLSTVGQSMCIIDSCGLSGSRNLGLTRATV